MGPGIAESRKRTYPCPRSCRARAHAALSSGQPAGSSPRALVQQDLNPSHYSERSPRRLSSRPGSPKPQEFSPLPRVRTPRPLAAPGGPSSGDSGPLDPGTPAAVLLAAEAAQAGIPGGQLCALCLSRYRKAAEAAPPEVAAEAGESRAGAREPAPPPPSGAAA